MGAYTKNITVSMDAEFQDCLGWHGIAMLERLVSIR